MNSKDIKYLLVISMLWAGCSVDPPARVGGKFQAAKPGDGDIIKDPLKDPSPVITPPAVIPEAGPDITLSLIESRGTVRVHPYRVLIHKLASVTGLAKTSEPLVLAAKISQSLGSYNYAAGVLPESKWSADMMGAWKQVVDLTCSSAALQSSLQKSDGWKAFLEKAHGRPLSPADTQMIADLTAEKLSAASQARILCTVVLTSTEFVTL